MARMPYAPAGTAESNHPLNLFRMLGHSPPVMNGVERLGSAILGESSLAPRLRELAIVRVGLYNDAPYEFSKHLAIARWVGVTEEELAAIEPGGNLAALGPVEGAVIRLTDELCTQARGSDAVFETLREHLTHAALVELVVTIGFYSMVCRVLQTFGVDQEASL